jgi:hypothetical protein
MMKSIIIGTTKKRGRGRPPTTGAWIAKQGDPSLSRPEAIRRVLDQALPLSDAKRGKKPKEAK